MSRSFATDEPSPPGEEGEDFFDSSFLSELQQLASSSLPPGLQATVAAAQGNLAEFLAPAGTPSRAPVLTEEEFLELPDAEIMARTNALIDVCRQGEPRQAAQAVESFVVFFQALLPTLAPEGAREVKRLFFRLVPTLIHIAYNDFAQEDDKRSEGRAALRNLETVLIEISTIRLTPNETDLVFRSVDQMAAFIGAGEYAMASEIISSQLLSIIARNKLTRALYRLMEVEVQVQAHLKERLGYLTPQIRLPQDVPVLGEYGPLRVFEDSGPEGDSQRFIQIQLPDIPILKDIVLHLVEEGTASSHDLRLDALGSAQLDLPDGMYSLGLIYQPE